MQTSLTTLVNGEIHYLAVGKREEIGVANWRKIYLQKESASLTLSWPEWAPHGKCRIDIKGRGKAKDTQSLLPAHAKAQAGWGMVTAADPDPKNRDKRLWTPEHAEGGHYYFRYMDTNLFLAVSADGYPTLSETAAPWRLGPLESVDLTAL